MEEKYHIGDFIEAEFIWRREGVKNWMHIFATVTDVDRYYILFTDNEGQQYLIQKRDIKKYIPQKFKNQKEIGK